jgi:hypothetical protein
MTSIEYSLTIVNNRHATLIREHNAMRRGATT